MEFSLENVTSIINAANNKNTEQYQFGNIRLSMFPDDADRFGAIYIVLEVLNKEGSDDTERVVVIRYRSNKCYSIVFDSNEQKFRTFVEKLNFCDGCLSDKAYELDFVQQEDNGDISYFIRYYSVLSKKAFRIRCTYDVGNNALKCIRVYPLER